MQRLFVIVAVVTGIFLTLGFAAEPLFFWLAALFAGSAAMGYIMAYAYGPDHS